MDPSSFCHACDSDSSDNKPSSNSNLRSRFAIKRDSVLDSNLGSTFSKQLQTVQLMEYVKRDVLFEGIEPKELDKLIADMTKMRLIDGQPIFTPNDSADFLFFCTRGRVEIRNDQKLVHTANPGDVFGANELLDGRSQYRYTAIPFDGAYVWRISKDNMFKYANPEVIRAKSKVSKVSASVVMAAPAPKPSDKCDQCEVLQDRIWELERDLRDERNKRRIAERERDEDGDRFDAEVTRMQTELSDEIAKIYQTNEELGWKFERLSTQLEEQMSGRQKAEFELQLSNAQLSTMKENMNVTMKEKHGEYQEVEAALEAERIKSNMLERELESLRKSFAEYKDKHRKSVKLKKKPSVESSSMMENNLAMMSSAIQICALQEQLKHFYQVKSMALTSLTEASNHLANAMSRMQHKEDTNLDEVYYFIRELEKQRRCNQFPVTSNSLVKKPLDAQLVSLDLHHHHHYDMASSPSSYQIDFDSPISQIEKEFKQAHSRAKTAITTLIN